MKVDNNIYEKLKEIKRPVIIEVSCKVNQNLSRFRILNPMVTVSTHLLDCIQ